MRVVELQVGADVDQQRALPAQALDLARGERCTSTPLDDERPAVEGDDLSKFGGWGGRPASVWATKRLLVAIRSSGEWPSSKPIVEETFWSMSGPPHSEPAQVAGPHLAGLAAATSSLS